MMQGDERYAHQRRAGEASYIIACLGDRVARCLKCHHNCCWESTSA